MRAAWYVGRSLMLMMASALPAAGLAEPFDIVGTYRLISSTRQIVDTGEVVDTFGKHPTGQIMYAPDGHFSAMIVYDERPKPESIDRMTDAQRVELFRKMLAYAGTYTFDGQKVEHRIDMSWNQVWTGTTVIRDVHREGDRIVYVTRPAPFSGDGKMSITTLVWEKVKPK